MSPSTSLLVVVIAILAALAARTVPHRPLLIVPFYPKPPPALDGPYALNTVLTDLCVDVTLAHPFDLAGAETAIASPDGLSWYTATSAGVVARIDVDGDVDAGTALLTAHPLAYLGGRPLGLALHPELGVVVADAARGLFSVSEETGIVTLLAASVDPEGTDPILYADDVDVDADSGTIYFSDASTIAPWRNADNSFETFEASVKDALEAGHTGRLLAYHPANRSVEVLADGLYFANGVALSEDKTFVVVAETFAARVSRVWLTSDRRGDVEVLIDNLPGYPDGVSAFKETFWISIAAPRSKFLELVHPYAPVKSVFSLLPRWMVPKPRKHGMAIQIDPTGAVVRTLHDPSGEVVPMVTGIHAMAVDRLLIGNLKGDGIILCRGV
ncbi:strictosidine synthase [Thecamonas trahens ATCC 50062]|uniref:Strictosidine synthase n=1 Tax=Thecamonas trahens ATCC 50062 TaxID=461836 RepID=A0A0L0D4L2_THETB|nr:strictosidine synthase [Thecamonas trahens ATCC 50062]KNC47297.1 strictosidine synthase [Thecamonas trahens ATCC 50062]|eukprot:XP_013759638.1 strictosidine synthase [Thecamonas trahens ATCC 50062]